MSQITPPRILSCGVIPVFLGKEKPLFLILRSYKYWDFPKGRVEVGEEPFSAALRELREETTLTEVEFRWGKDFRETPLYANGKIARYYVAEAKHTDVSLPLNPVLKRPEHHEFRWVSFEETHLLLVPRVKLILDWADHLISHAEKD